MSLLKAERGLLCRVFLVKYVGRYTGNVFEKNIFGKVRRVQYTSVRRIIPSINRYSPFARKQKAMKTVFHCRTFSVITYNVNDVNFTIFVQHTNNLFLLRRMSCEFFNLFTHYFQEVNITVTSYTS